MVAFAPQWQSLAVATETLVSVQQSWKYLLCPLQERLNKFLNPWVHGGEEIHLQAAHGWVHKRHESAKDIKVPGWMASSTQWT